MFYINIVIILIILDSIISFPVDDDEPKILREGSPDLPSTNLNVKNTTTKNFSKSIL